MIAFGWGLTVGVFLATIVMQQISENDKLKSKIEEFEYAIKTLEVHGSEHDGKYKYHIYL